MNLSASCPNLLEAADIPTTVAGVSVLTPNLPPYDGDQEEDDSAHSFVKRQPAKRWPRGLPRRFSHDQVPVIIISSEAKLTEAASAEGTSERDDKSYLGKSMEILSTQQPESDVGPFRREIGIGSTDEEAFLPTALHGLLENPENETRWYFKYFLGKVHLNYLCYDHEKNPFYLSVVSSDSIYHCILWMKMGNKRLSIEGTSNGKWPSPKYILEKFSITKYDKNIREVNTANLQRDLLTLEEQEGAVNFKFGVLYATAGQCTDDDMFSNQNGSAEFIDFLNLLGDEVELAGWEHYKGGLDTRCNATGTHSVYTVYEGHEVMFHVSTKLPYSEGNKQQLERKRHIGNDIVVIIFVDGEDDAAYNHAMNFNPGCMKSHFNHIFALVTYCRGRGTYRIVMHLATKVPSFGPPMPPNGEFSNRIAFRDFLLAKLINGEKASYRIPTFSEKTERTLDLLLKSLEQKCNSDYRLFLGPPTLASTSPSVNTNRKFQAMEESFLDLGQRLKVEKIIKGHHPTSQRTTVAVRNDPWEIQCVATEFPHSISCGDVCDDGSLVVATPSNGTFIISREGSHSLVIDSSVQIGQLVVAQKHDVMLFRTCYPKDNNYLYCIYLEDLFKEKVKVNSKASIGTYQIPNTKGCHLFCTSPLDSPFLRIAVAIKNRVEMLAWKYQARLSISSALSGAPMRTLNPVESFIKHRELTLSDAPSLMTLVDERPTGKLCVSYHEHKQAAVDVIDEVMAVPQRIPNLDISKGKLVTLFGTHSAGRSEILLGYSLTSLLLTLSDGTVNTSTEIVWNTEPKNIVHMSPYMLAFTSNSIEIRKADNGSLMQTINAPDVHMFSHKGDLYFTSPLRLSNCRFDKQDTKPLPSHKPLDRRSSQPTKPQHPGPAETLHVYRISADTLTGGGYRRASTASTGSSISTQASDSVRTSISDDAGSDTFSQDTLEHRSGSPVVVRTCSQGTPTAPQGCSYVLTSCNSEGGSPNGMRKRFSRKVALLGRPIIMETDSEGALSLSSEQLLRENVSREHSVCSSPDSGVLTDDCSVTLSDWKTKSLTPANSHTSPPPSAARDSADD